MKKIIISVVLAALVTSLTILTIFEIQAQRAQLEADSSEVINSKILGQKRKLLVHLPRSYSENTDKRYPVIYALDATSHDQDILTASTILNLSEHIPELIVVGIVNENRNKDLTPPFVLWNSSEPGNGDLLFEYLKYEVVPLINEKYRTSDYSMVSGNSRAGLFALYCMVEDPNLFDAYFCYSPAFWRDNNIIAKKLEESLILNSPDVFLYLSIGQNENEKMKNGFDKVIEILKRSDSTELQLYYDYTSSASHGTNAFYSIPKALTVWDKKR